MSPSKSTKLTLLGIGTAAAILAVAVPQMAHAAAPAGKPSPSPSPTATATATPTPTPTPTVGTTAYFATGAALNIAASDAPTAVPVASTPSVAPGNYIVNATADFYDVDSTSDGNLAVSCKLKLKNGGQESIPAGQRVHIASDASVALTWAFPNVADGDSFVLACQAQSGYSFQVSHSSLTAIPVASISQ